MTENKLASSAVLVDFSISMWSGRRQAKSEAADITSKAKADSKAAAVSKHLMVGTPELAAVQAAAAELRSYILHYTLPWSDSGMRLLPMSLFNTFADGVDERSAKFKSAVDVLVAAYPTIVSTQAFKLGALFNRAEYPNAGDIRRRFAVHVRMLPVPDTGHFLLDAHQETVQKLQERAQADKQASLDKMMADAWKRLYDAVKKLNTTVTPQEDGKPRRIYDATLGGIQEVTSLLTGFNVNNDPALEAARVALEEALAGVTPATLRADETGQFRDEVRTKTQHILDKFDFMGAGDAEESDNS